MSPSLAVMSNHAGLAAQEQIDRAKVEIDQLGEYDLHKKIMATEFKERSAAREKS